MNNYNSHLFNEIEAYNPLRGSEETEAVEYHIPEEQQENLLSYETPYPHEIFESDYSQQELTSGEIEESEAGLLDKFGDVVVRIINLQKTPGYEDPANSGNPLMYVDNKNRSQSLSANFTVGEFARAQEGRYKWNLYRVDADFIKELQILRDSLGKPIVIIDGYYPPKYQKDILRRALTQNPHFSGRGVKIKAAGITPKTLAENILMYCDPSLSVSVGDDSVSFYIKQKLPRITSYITNTALKSEMINHLTEFDKKIQAGVVQVLGLNYEEIPEPLVKMLSPVNDLKLTGDRIKQADYVVKDIISVLDKFMLGKSDTDQFATYMKSMKNFTKLSEQISNLDNGKTLAELIKNDVSGIDFKAKLKLLSNSFGLIETVAKLSSISEKKKKYEEFLQNNQAAKAYLAVDVIEGIGKLTMDIAGLGLAIATVLAADAATKARLLETAGKLEKISKGFSVFIEGAKIIRNIVSIIILISEGKYSKITDHVIDIGKSIATIAATLKFGTGFLALATGIYLFYKFILDTLPTMVGDNVRAIAMGSTIIALRELNQEFVRITRAFLHVNNNYERILNLVGHDELKLASHPNLQQRLFFDFRWFHRELHSFHKYVGELEYTTRSEMGYYKSFPSIPFRIFNKSALFKVEGINIVISQFPKKSTDFSFVYADNLNNYYQVFYDGIIKCHLEFPQIYEERVQTGWGKDPFSKEIEDNEIELFENIDEAYTSSESESFEDVPQEQFLSSILTKLNLNKIKQTSLLNSSANAAALAKNKVLSQKSGITSASILKALGAFVDLNDLRSIMTQHNTSNPGSTYQLSSQDPIDALFTEAVHQFQIANYINPKEHDGILGTSTLETLGFVDHKLKSPLNSSGFYGQAQLNQIKSQVAAATNNQYTASNWFNYIVKPAWLGIKISDGIHILLLQKLRDAEAWLKTKQQYKNLSPSELGKALGFTASTSYSGARLSADKQAMHAFGLALDIHSWGNPWVGAGWIQDDSELMKERTRFIDALRNASGEKLPGNTIFAYLNSVAENSGTDTSAAYNTLKQKNDQFVNYLRSNPSELKYWQNSATFGKRDPLSGWLNLHHDLVYALREVAGLAWGAIDFGPYASGDVMHFDMRTLGVGKIICTHIRGFVPSKGHPAINRETFSYEEPDQSTEHHEAIEEGEWTGSLL